MIRATVLVGMCTLVAGCFDPVPAEACAEGTKDCPCVDLQCEAGLICQNAVCVQEEVVTGTGPQVTSTGNPMETTGSPTTADGGSTSTMASTTNPVDGSTTGDGSSSGGTGSESTGGSTSTGASLCGNMMLDTDEMCDGTPGCETDCTLTNYDCNPLNNVPCTEGFKCSVVEPDGEPVNAVCLPFADPPPGMLFESNCFFDFGPHDEWCDVGLACALSQSTDACDVNCCVEFCDLLDATFECAFKGDTCQPFFTPQAPEGLAQLGFCITP
ncbi:MAG: hypothetical protein AAF721_27040 [Myxococcota bacterium]